MKKRLIQVIVTCACLAFLNTPLLMAQSPQPDCTSEVCVNNLQAAQGMQSQSSVVSNSASPLQPVDQNSSPQAGAQLPASNDMQLFLKGEADTKPTPINVMGVWLAAGACALSLVALFVVTDWFFGNWKLTRWLLNQLTHQSSTVPREETDLTDL